MAILCSCQSEPGSRADGRARVFSYGEKPVTQQLVAPQQPVRRVVQQPVQNVQPQNLVPSVENSPSRYQPQAAPAPQPQTRVVQQPRVQQQRQYVQTQAPKPANEKKRIIMPGMRRASIAD